jgi:hypothetical protein
MEKKLYALITNKQQGWGYGAIVVQVSFNKKELEEIADYLNKMPYFSPHAHVEEVTDSVCEWYWPHSYRG